MSAFLAKEKKSIEDFVAGKNHHQELADSLDINYRQAKRIGLGLFYGMGHDKLASTLSASISEAIKIKDTFKQKYIQTFTYIEGLSYLEAVSTPLLSRKVRYRVDMRDTKKFN
jgi:DNA polymerase I-like protein with 3'-5' exonuclease and polymerase domains